MQWNGNVRPQSRLKYSLHVEDHMSRHRLSLCIINGKAIYSSVLVKEHPSCSSCFAAPSSSPGRMAVTVHPLLAFAETGKGWPRRRLSRGSVSDDGQRCRHRWGFTSTSMRIAITGAVSHGHAFMSIWGSGTASPTSRADPARLHPSWIQLVEAHNGTPWSVCLIWSRTRLNTWQPSTTKKVKGQFARWLTMRVKHIRIWKKNRM